MAGISGTNIVAPVVPLDTADVHPTHDAVYGKGGYRVVAANVDRDAIATPRRSEGMLVYVTGTGKTWRLSSDLTTWVEVVTASSWSDITGKPSTFPPDLNGNVTFTGDDASTGSINGSAAYFTTLVFANLTSQTTAFTSTLKTKLDGIASGATANATDAQLRDRSTHTGTQAASTITGLAAVATSGSASDIGTGTLPAARLPATTVTAAAYGSASSVATFTVGSDGRLTAAGSTAISVAASAVSSGTLATARLGSGTGSSSNFLRGDGAWSTIAAANVSGLAVSATTDATNAANITSGTIATARLPASSTSAAGITAYSTTAQALAGTNAGTAVTPQAMNLSRRGGGRTKFFELFTDFAMSASGINEGTDGFVWGRNVSGTGADSNTYTNRFLSFSRPGAGILSLITGTTSSGRAGIDSWNDSGIFRYDQGLTTFETLIYIPSLATASDDYVFRAGFVQSGGIGQDLMAFEYNRSNSANWVGVCGAFASYSRVDTGVAVAASKWILLSMRFTEASCTFNINGSDVGAITSNIRADGAIKLGFHIIKTAGTTSASVLLDYCHYRHDFSSDRTWSP